MNNIVRISKGKLLLCSGLLAAALFALHPAFTTPAHAADYTLLGGGGGGGAGDGTLGSGGAGGAGGAGGGFSAGSGDPGGNGTGGNYGTSAENANGITGGGTHSGTSGGNTPTLTPGVPFNGNFDDIHVIAGSGGWSGNVGEGGNGGAVVRNIDGTVTAVDVNVTAGHGGDTLGHAGGVGGASSLNIQATGSLTASGVTTITGGDAGANGVAAGVGGAATFTVGAGGTFTSQAGYGVTGIQVIAGINGGAVDGGTALLQGTGTVISNTHILVQNNNMSTTGAKAVINFDGTIKMVDNPARLPSPDYPIYTPTYLSIKADDTLFAGSGNVSIFIRNLEAKEANVSLDPTNDSSYFHVGEAIVSNGWHPTGNILRLDNARNANTFGPESFFVDTVKVLGKGRLALTNGPVNTIGRLDAHGAGLSVLSQDYLTDAWTFPGGSVVNHVPFATVNSADITNTALSVDDRNGRLGMFKRSDIAELIRTDDHGLTANIKHYRTESYQGDLYSLEVRGKNRVELTLTSDVLKAYAEARAANLAFLNQGSDLILNQGFGSAIAATASPGWKAGMFGAVSGGWSRYDTGSHVEVSGASMLVGVGVGNDAGPGRFTGGIFFEAGWGSYNSYNSFSNGDVNGDGNTDYYGGGLLARYDVTSDALKGLYVDFAARMGHTSSDFNTSDIKYTSSIPNWFLGDADFDIDSMYYGIMAGVGYKWSITDKATLDLSGHFIWTHQESDSTNVYFDHVTFDDADSLRTRLGGRFSYAVSENFSPYVGAYWDYEFDGESKAKVNGWKVDSPDLEGSTGVGELGLTLKPVADSGFSMDLGVQGYLGVREGVTGSLQLKYEF